MRMKNWSVRTSSNCWLSSMLAPCSKSRAVTVATIPRWSGQERMRTFSVGAVVSGTRPRYVHRAQGRTTAVPVACSSMASRTSGAVVCSPIRFRLPFPW